MPEQGQKGRSTDSRECAPASTHSSSSPTVRELTAKGEHYIEQVKDTKVDHNNTLDPWKP
eukprot:scaffold257519_cov15-Tisochrysis_lutea.AAC.1